MNEKHQFQNNKTILAASVCSDEVIGITTHFQEYVQSVQPFQLGGLAGFPFAGITGFQAFAGHIPDDGYAVILYGPHIGITKSGQQGKVQRTGQSEETTCCGALLKGLDILKKQQDENAGLDEELDYQQLKILQDLDNKHEWIVDSGETPVKRATEVMYERIDTRIKKLLDQTSTHFQGKKVALIGGIIINTDYETPDWFESREFSVHTF